MTIQVRLKLVFVALLIFSATAFAGVPELFEAENLPPNLRWKKISIPVAFSNSLLKTNPAIRPDSDVQGAVRRSLEAWEAVTNIEFQVIWTDKLTVSSAGNAGDGISLITIAQTPENLLVFSGEAEEVSARTRIFFNRRGEISEADIVLNPYQQFSTDGSIGTFDLESTLTHEIGHLLGLEHSVIIGSTMNEHQGKNGLFNLPNFSLRTLSLEDISQVRALYGAKTDEICCGAADGRIIVANQKSAKNLQLWLEESETGRVVAGGGLNPDGSFLIRGLEAGKYRIFIRDATGGYAGADLGEIEVSKGKSTSFIKKVPVTTKDFDAQLIGFNGQLSKLAVPINSGKSYLIYIGGKNLDPDQLKIGSTSPFFTVTSGTFTRHDYGKELSVFSFEIKSLIDTPLGEYTIYLQKPDGKIEFLTGSLSVEKFVNSWNSVTFD